MQTTIKSFCVSLVLVSALLFTNTAKAQKVSHGDQIEKVFSFWSLTMEQVRVQVGATQNEYGVFQRFCRHSIDSVYIEFTHKINDSLVWVNNVEQYMNSKKPYFAALYNNFKKIEEEYPSSVSEYNLEPHPRIGGDSCFATCYNTGFQDGTFNGWYGYYAENSSPAGSFNYTHVTGGYLGAVRKAAQDPLTLNHYQLQVTSPGLTDWFLRTYSTYSMPEVSPWSGNHSVLLGDTTYPNQGMAILSQSFLVTSSNADLTYQYSVLLEAPGSHSYYEQPIFWVSVLDQHGDTIPTCGAYSVNADSTHTRGGGGFKSIWYSREGDSVFWKNWTLVNVPLKHYIGQCVTIIFQVQDCSLSGHFGYAYVDASCSPLGLLSSSPNFCGQDSITLTGPPGASKYTWRGPLGHNYTGIRNHDSTTQTISIDSSGIYRLITVPVTGAACADTIYDTIGKLNGRPPRPSFTAPIVCVGQPTVFTNTSNPDSGIFSWDFYNLGIYNYVNMNNDDTTWTYSSPGVYTVKLHELYHGCGTDTLIKVTVDTAVGSPTFTAAPLCTDDSTYFTPTAAHATKYDWHFGDPASGIHDSSKSSHPGHYYRTPGTYTVTIKAINGGNCDAIDSFPITIVATPKPIISGRDSVCIGGTATLSVSGGTTYVWTPTGATTTSISIVGSVTETITVNASNGSCTHDTTFKLTVVPAVSASIISTQDSVCSGDSLTLQGRTGLRYRWSPGSATTATIHTRPVSTTTYTLYTYSGSCEDSITKTIPVIPQISANIAANVDSICPGERAIITSTGIGGQVTYLWSPGGETTANINVSPDSTTTYTATVVGLCNTVHAFYKIIYVPLPVPTISGTNWKCRGVRDTLTVSNGNGPATYVWSNGKTTTSIYTGLIDGDSTISVVAYNKLGCPHDTTFAITLRQPLTITVPPPATFCAGNQVCISAQVHGTPLNPVSYSWSPGGETSDTICVSPTDTTNYVVTVSNGCKSSKATLLMPNYPNLTACCNQTVSMLNDTVTPSFVTLTANGNSIKYHWVDSNKVVCLDPLCDSVRATPTVTTTYAVIGIDASGCTTEQLITITVDVPCFNLTIPNVFTPGNPGLLGLDNEFYIKTNNIDAWSITIFDRWGKEVFSTTDQYKYWTGNTESGGQAPAGVYYYVITGTCQNTTYKKDGFLQLIR